MGCSEGGTSIEDLAESHPEKIIKIAVDIRVGLTDAQVCPRARAPQPRERGSLRAMTAARARSFGQRE